MVDKKPAAGVKGLAAMFEQNISQVNTQQQPLQRRNTKKLASNPFEQNLQANSAATQDNTTKPAPAQPKKKLNNPFEQNIQAQATNQPPPLKKPAPKPTPAAAPTTPTPATNVASSTTAAASNEEAKTVNKSQVTTGPPKKLANNPFEANIQAAQNQLFNSKSEINPPPKKKLLNNPFEQNIQNTNKAPSPKSKPQAPPIKQPAEQQTPALVALSSSSEVMTETTPAKPAQTKKPGLASIFEQNISQSQVQVSKPILQPATKKPAAPPKTEAPTAAPATAVQATANSTVQEAKNATNLRNKIGGAFKPKERTPSPSEERKQEPAQKKKLQMNVFSMDSESDEDEKKDQPPVKRPVKPMKRDAGGNDEGGDPDDFKNRLAAMLSRGPSATVAKKPPVISAMQTNEEIVDAKLSIPKVTRQRANTKKYDLAQFDFDGF